VLDRRRPAICFIIDVKAHDLSSRSRLPNRNLLLVVDDDVSMLTSVARLLRQFGTAEAFASHRDFGGAGCIILDIDLGDGSGIELRHHLKAANISVPVIYMTGNESPVVREAALRSGCLGFLTKPFSAASLVENCGKRDASR